MKSGFSVKKGVFVIKDIDKLIERICSEIKLMTDIAVIGMSGGADSTLVTALCVRALGADNVLGVHMPYNDYDNQTFNKRSKFIADNLGINSMNVNIFQPCINLEDAIESASNLRINPMNFGNIKARMRMAALYSIAHSIETEAKGEARVRVIGTGNFSEDFIGYDTKWGDSACDIFPIGNLFKSEVYQLLDYFIEEGILHEEMIDRVPSAGLWDGQTDEGELGYSYNEMEPSIRKIISEEWSEEDWSEVDEFVWNRHMANKHKHEAVPVIDVREYCD